MAEKIHVTFLGSGSAVPTDSRNHPSMLLQYGAENILIDCGEGTQRQFRKAGLNPMKLTRILITHWHGDHVLGLPGIFQTMMLYGYKEKIMLYGPKGSKVMARKYLDLLANRGVSLDLEVKEVANEVIFENEDFVIDAKEMNHSVPAVAYSFTFKEKRRLDKEKLEALKLPNSPLLGKLARGEVVEFNGKKIDGKKLLFVEPQRKVTIVMDTLLNDNAIALAKDSDVLICESTYISDEQELAISHYHLTAADGAMIAKKSKSKRLMLTHPSQKYDKIPKVLITDAKKVFDNVSVASDLERFEL